MKKIRLLLSIKLVEADATYEAVRNVIDDELGSSDLWNLKMLSGRGVKHLKKINRLKKLLAILNRVYRK